MKFYKDMTRAELDRADTKANKEVLCACEALIAAGRGHERPNETRAARDPLAEQWRVAMDTASAINRERDRRMTYHGSLNRIRTAA